MLKLMTMNLNAYGTKAGPWRDRLPLIEAAIEQNRPDVLAFQAVRREPGVEDGMDQAQQIARRFPEYRHGCFEPASTQADGSADGLAFLSRYGFTGFDYRRLSFMEGTDDPNHRVVLHAQFEFDSQLLHVFNAHFSWVGEQADQNLNETLEYLNQFKGNRVVLGDFNQTPDSKVIRRFQQLGWVDAWTRLNPGDEGYTFALPEPSIRIDYAMVGPELEGKLQSIRVIANDQGANGVAPSDHAGLLVTMENLGDSSPN